MVKGVMAAYSNPAWCFLWSADRLTHPVFSRDKRATSDDVISLSKRTFARPRGLPLLYFSMRIFSTLADGTSTRRIEHRAHLTSFRLLPHD